MANYRNPGERKLAEEQAAQNAANSAYHQSDEYLLNNPVNFDYQYQFGDWLSGTEAAAKQGSTQAQLDYAEFVRNQYSAAQQRAWEEYMSNTQVQRAMSDIKAAGLNPWLAVQSAGFGGSVPQGAVANSSAGQAASGNGAGSAVAATALGIAAIVKAIAKIVRTL